jgi:hypothetical protein
MAAVGLARFVFGAVGAVLRYALGRSTIDVPSLVSATGA